MHSNPATYVLPSGAASVKYLSTRTRLDALGKPFYIQGADHSPQPNDTPTTLITYQHVPALDATSVTTRLSVFDNASHSLTGIDTSYPHQRVSRQITNSLGQTVMTLQRMNNFSASDGTGATSLNAESIDYTVYGLDQATYSAIESNPHARRGWAVWR